MNEDIVYNYTDDELNISVVTNNNHEILKIEVIPYGPIVYGFAFNDTELDEKQIEQRILFRAKQITAILDNKIFEKYNELKKRHNKS